MIVDGRRRGPAGDAVLSSVLDFLIRNQSWILPSVVGAAIVWYFQNRAYALTNQFHNLLPGRGFTQLLLPSFAIVILAICFLLQGIASYFDVQVVKQTALLDVPQPYCTPARPDSRIAVVFLHGWNGSGDGSWGKFPQLACTDDGLSQTQIFLANYPTFMARRELPISRMARWLRQDFFSDALFPQFEQIHIVAHSMGGLIARRIYLQDTLQRGASTIRSLVTIASPYQGADIAGLASALGISKKLVDDMTPDSSFLQSLSDDWSDVRTKPLTYCFTSPQDSIVKQNSAKSQCECNFDFTQWGHIDMVKPDSVQDDRYRAPMRALKRALVPKPGSNESFRQPCL